MIAIKIVSVEYEKRHNAKKIFFFKYIARKINVSYLFETMRFPLSLGKSMQNYRYFLEIILIGAISKSIEYNYFTINIL